MALLPGSSFLVRVVNNVRLLEIEVLQVDKQLARVAFSLAALAHVLRKFLLLLELVELVQELFVGRCVYADVVARFSRHYIVVFQHYVRIKVAHEGRLSSCLRQFVSLPKRLLDVLLYFIL